jgi:hypothetical protein
VVYAALEDNIPLNALPETFERRIAKDRPARVKFLDLRERTI